jgi:hypothetical protein
LFIKYNDLFRCGISVCAFELLKNKAHVEEKLRELTSRTLEIFQHAVDSVDNETMAKIFDAFGTGFPKGKLRVYTCSKELAASPVMCIEDEERNTAYSTGPWISHELFRAYFGEAVDEIERLHVAYHEELDEYVLAYANSLRETMNTAFQGRSNTSILWYNGEQRTSVAHFPVVAVELVQKGDSDHAFQMIDSDGNRSENLYMLITWQ